MHEGFVSTTLGLPGIPAEAEEIIVALEPEDSGKLPQITSLLSLVRVPFTVVPSLLEEKVLAGGQTDIAPVRVLAPAGAAGERKR